MLDHRRVIASMALAGALITSTVARAQAPAGRYVVGSDSFPNDESLAVVTVYDTKTKLTWQQAVSDPVPLTALPGNRIASCADLTRDTGVPGWRLPTLKELFTLFDFTGSHGPFAAVDEQFFPNTPAAGFLSATTSPINVTQCVRFTGNFFMACNGDDTAYVRCVR